MNTAQIISRYARPDGTLDITASQLTHELVSAHQAGKGALLNTLAERHPTPRNTFGNKTSDGGKLPIHTVGRSVLV